MVKKMIFPQGKIASVPMTSHSGTASRAKNKNRLHSRRLIRFSDSLTIFSTSSSVALSRRATRSSISRICPRYFCPAVWNIVKERKPITITTPTKAQSNQADFGSQEIWSPNCDLTKYASMIKAPLPKPMRIMLRSDIQMPNHFTSSLCGSGSSG